MCALYLISDPREKFSTLNQGKYLINWFWTKNIFSFTLSLGMLVDLNVCFVVVSHQKFVRPAKQNKQFKSLDCWVGRQQFYQTLSWSLDSGGELYAFSSCYCLSHHIWDKRDTADNRFKMPRKAKLCDAMNNEAPQIWFYARQHPSYTLVILSLNLCRVVSFHLLLIWRRKKIFSRGKTSIDKENSALRFKIAEKSHQIAE